MDVESPLCHNHLSHHQLHEQQQQQQQHQQHPLHSQQQFYQHNQNQLQQHQLQPSFRRERLTTNITKRNKSHATIVKNNTNNRQHTTTAATATTTTSAATTTIRGTTKTDKVLPLFEGQSFPFRLWYLVNHEYYDDVIKWSDDGNYVIIMSENRFERKVCSLVFIIFLLLKSLLVGYI